MVWVCKEHDIITYSAVITACEKAGHVKCLKTSAKNPCGCWLGLPPTQDSSHHQDDITFLVGNPYKPSFATGILGGG